MGAWAKESSEAEYHNDQVRLHDCLHVMKSTSAAILHCESRQTLPAPSSREPCLYCCGKQVSPMQS